MWHELSIQVTSYKSDFEQERSDRENAHSKMADLQKKVIQLEGLTGHERVGYQHEIAELKRDYQAIKEKFHETDQQLQSHKQILADLEVVHQRHVQEANKDLFHWKDQAGSRQQEVRAKSSQVKQYAKENEKLKQQV